MCRFVHRPIKYNFSAPGSLAAQWLALQPDERLDSISESCRGPAYTESEKLRWLPYPKPRHWTGARSWLSPIRWNSGGQASIGLMQEWSEAHHVELRSVDPALGYELIEDGATCALGMLNLGFHSVALPDTQDWVRRFKDRFPDAPLVVVSDREEAEEVVIAFRGGAQGFIPTSTKPGIALQALSFIMNGGTFFPPGTLLRSAASASGQRRQGRAIAARHLGPCPSGLPIDAVTLRQTRGRRRFSGVRRA